LFHEDSDFGLKGENKIDLGQLNDYDEDMEDEKLEQLK
jgi:hypothetical protein